MTRQQVIDDVSPIIGRVGGAWYFAPETVQVGKDLGLGGLRLYFYGRGGVLGDVEWPVVLSAFGYFKPALIEKMWTTSRDRCDRATAVTAHLAALHDFGRRHLAAVSGLEGFCATAEAVTAAALEDPTGLTLFAGYAAQPLPDDAPARAMHHVAVLRELRGSVHLTAVVASGLPSAVAHAIRRPDDVQSFGWGEGEVPAPTEEDRRRLAAADRATDEVLARFYGGAGEGFAEVTRAIGGAVG